MSRISHRAIAELAKRLEDGVIACQALGERHGDSTQAYVMPSVLGMVEQTLMTWLREHSASADAPELVAEALALEPTAKQKATYLRELDRRLALFSTKKAVQS